jgi:protein-S-isoprenylcysteine O-methyltransferase Ste14
MTDKFVMLSFYGYFVVFLLVEFVLTRFRLGSGERGNRDRLSIVFFLIVPFLGMYSWMYCIKANLVAANPSWAYWGFGVAAGLSGFGIRLGAKKTLGRFFTVRVQLQEGHDVVETGLYKLVRHPLYLGYVLEWVAPPLLLGSPMGFLFTTLPILAGVLHRIPHEEKLLVEGLGEKYRAYMTRTKRLIPGVW